MKVPYGEADFKSIRKEGYIYIDKTMYIEKLETNKKVIYTRPRRFGKSVFTNMLDYYYSLKSKDEFEELFKGLSIKVFRKYLFIFLFSWMFLFI